MNDTPPEVDRAFTTLMMQRSEGDLAMMAFEMFDLARTLMTANIRARDPGISDVELRVQIFERTYGADFEVADRAKVVERIRSARSASGTLVTELHVSMKPADATATGAAQAAIDAETRRQMKQWLDQWKRAGPILEGERLERLRQLDDAESARIACDLVWPMGTLGDHRSGDDAAGLEPMKAALGKLGPHR